MFSSIYRYLYAVSGILCIVALQNIAVAQCSASRGHVAHYGQPVYRSAPVYASQAVAAAASRTGKISVVKTVSHGGGDYMRYMYEQFESNPALAARHAALHQSLIARFAPVAAADEALAAQPAPPANLPPARSVAAPVAEPAAPAIAAAPIESAEPQTPPPAPERVSPVQVASGAHSAPQAAPENVFSTEQTN